MKELDDLQKVYRDGLINKAEYYIKIMHIGSSKLIEETQKLKFKNDEPMMFRKIQCENGWIVFIVKDHNIVEVHSNGFVRIAKNFIVSDSDLLRLLEHNALDNQLQSQQPGQFGIQWPEEE